MEPENETRVLYNADCPVCRNEIDHYARISHEQALPIKYDDLNAPQMTTLWSIDPDDAARRLHVRKGDVVFSGIPAFIELWRDIPRYRWLARLVSIPGIYGFCVLVYDWILAPALFAWHKRRVRKASS